MKSYSLLAFIMLAFTLSVRAQNAGVQIRTDSSLSDQKTRPETPSLDPLANKKYGIEFSPIMLLIGWTGTGPMTYLAGGLSLFAVDRHAEVAFPILYVFGTHNNIPWRILNIEATYRRFLGNQQGGFYLSGGLRYTYDAGEELPYSSGRVSTGNQIVQNKFGLYAGIGYRYFHRSGLLWGCNIVVGRYLDNDSRHVGDGDLSTGPFLIDFELLKIGYAF